MKIFNQGGCYYMVSDNDAQKVARKLLNNEDVDMENYVLNEDRVVYTVIDLDCEIIEEDLEDLLKRP